MVTSSDVHFHDECVNHCVRVKLRGMPQFWMAHRTRQTWRLTPEITVRAMPLPCKFTWNVLPIRRCVMAPSLPAGPGSILATARMRGNPPGIAADAASSRRRVLQSLMQCPQSPPGISCSGADQQGAAPEPRISFGINVRILIRTPAGQFGTQATQRRHPALHHGQQAAVVVDERDADRRRLADRCHPGGV